MRLPTVYFFDLALTSCFNLQSRLFKIDLKWVPTPGTVSGIQLVSSLKQYLWIGILNRPARFSALWRAVFVFYFFRQSGWVPIHPRLWQSVWFRNHQLFRCSQANSLFALSFQWLFRMFIHPTFACCLWRLCSITALSLLFWKKFLAWSKARYVFYLSSNLNVLTTHRDSVLGMIDHWNHYLGVREWEGSTKNRAMNRVFSLRRNFFILLWNWYSAFCFRLLNCSVIVCTASR